MTYASVVFEKVRWRARISFKRNHKVHCAYERVKLYGVPLLDLKEEKREWRSCSCRCGSGLATHLALGIRCVWIIPPLYPNDLEQRSHWYGFIPKWVALTCKVLFEGDVNFFPQYGHTKFASLGLAGVFDRTWNTALCRRNWSIEEKFLLHSLHDIIISLALPAARGVEVQFRELERGHDREGPEDRGLEDEVAMLLLPIGVLL